MLNLKETVFEREMIILISKQLLMGGFPMACREQVKKMIVYGGIALL